MITSKRQARSEEILPTRGGAGTRSRQARLGLSARRRVREFFGFGRQNWDPGLQGLRSSSHVAVDAVNHPPARNLGKRRQDRDGTLSLRARLVTGAPPLGNHATGN